MEPPRVEPKDDVVEIPFPKGLKLAAILLAIALATFIVMLDASILATVRDPSASQLRVHTNCPLITGCSLHH